MSRRLPPEPTVLSYSILPVMTDPEKLHELRRLLSGFSHRCRNSLNGMKMSLYLFRREARERIPSCWGELERTYQQIEVLFDQLQALYRPMTLTMVRSSLSLLILDRAPKWQELLQNTGRTLHLDPPAGEDVGDYDPIRLGLGLDALASWRAESSEWGTQTRVGWRTHEGSFEMCWEEQSKVSPSPSSLLDGSGSHPSPPPHSLVFPLLTRILQAHGGRVESPDQSALCLKFRWPQFQDTRTIKT
jgi:hypothetical protein